ncbi:MAG TPA: TspO/MBR family protein [Thermoanaerobaculia bacterium]|nr:TspO/MBR family protein [Thermoanaerobaculia bacterium]
MKVLGSIVCVALPLLAGAIGGIASRSAPAFYAQLVKPEWAPPPWLFGPVWTVLYLMMGLRRCGDVRSHAELDAVAAESGTALVSNRKRTAGFPAGRKESRKLVAHTGFESDHVSTHATAPGPDGQVSGWKGASLYRRTPRWRRRRDIDVTVVSMSAVSVVGTSRRCAPFDASAKRMKRIARMTSSVTQPGVPLFAGAAGETRTGGW